ncbi:hypothetical protein G6F54_014573 [Rhizopus delemar]|nr:hypothetical protein G6F54_014573 [Rhizopus delemar]
MPCSSMRTPGKTSWTPSPIRRWLTTSSVTRWSFLAPASPRSPWRPRCNGRMATMPSWKNWKSTPRCC